MCWPAFLKTNGEGRGRGKGRVASKEVATKHHLTDEELKAVFKKHDGNGDGHIDKSELTEAFKELGCHLPGWRASQSIHQNDFDLDGDIDEHEIDHLVSYVRSIGF